MQLANEIRRRIEWREWTGRLPGVFRLMSEFGATRRTVEAALGMLREEGLISGPGRRSAMLIHGPQPHVAPRGSVLIYESPPMERSSDHLALFLILERRLPRPVQRLHLPRGMKRSEQLRRIAGLEVSHAVVLDVEGELADAVKARGIRTVALGVATPPATVAAFAVCYRELVVSSLARLFDAGHTRITMPLFQRNPRVVARVRDIVEREFAARDIPYSDLFNTPVVDGDTPQDLHEAIRRLWRLTPPTAIIVNHLRPFLAVFSCLASLGLRVPEHASVICLSHSAEMDAMEPEPSHFCYPVERMARAIIEALEQGAADASNSLLFSPAWRPGRSVAPPRGR
ncbi:substrate-binding domain-containing protein [Luteolibacter ambystomatis]|uniref:substrate-binding domain-containing protein n=1 Tax=Luteolibacter ambystomatis TaxID=2824561 RepID=UPI0036DE20E0